MEIAKMIDALIVREGGYVNHKDDKGGPTKYGITAKTLGEYRKLGRKATAAEVMTLQKPEVVEIYRDEYLIRPKFNKIADPKTQEFVFDCGVHHGVDRAARFVQMAAEVAIDGKVGPKTLAAINQLGEGALILLVAQRIRFMGKILENNHAQAEFAAGWLDRCADFLDGGN